MGLLPSPTKPETAPTDLICVMKQETRPDSRYRNELTPDFGDPRTHEGEDEDRTRRDNNHLQDVDHDAP